MTATARVAALALAFAAVLGCGPRASGGGAPSGAASVASSAAPAPAASSAPVGVPASAAPSASAAPESAAARSVDAGDDIASTPVESAYPGRTDGCPERMVRVEGEYCPAVMQDCLEHHKEWKDHGDDKNVSERCLRYAAPSKCVSSKRRHASFCMDRFEYPNKVGELPRVLTS